MDNDNSLAQVTATSLKKELRESLEILQADFAGLQHFVVELTSEEQPTPVALTKADLDDLLAVSQEIQDAASNIEFEANKIRDKLSRIIV